MRGIGLLETFLPAKAMRAIGSKNSPEPDPIALRVFVCGWDFYNLPIDEVSRAIGSKNSPELDSIELGVRERPSTLRELCRIGRT